MKFPFKNSFRRLLAWQPVAALLSWPLVRSYVNTHKVKKLHLGGNGHPEWLNTDLFPSYWKTARLDATQPFPLPSSSFDLVFSEHMIEHVTLAGARRMLAECHRVLRRGGRIRIATPDLARVLSLYAATEAPLQVYLRSSISHNRLSTDLPASVVVINSLFHDHGHCFLYDEETLSALLRAAGFQHLRRHVPGQSDYPELRNLEVHHHAIGHEANNFETLILEAQKP